MVAILRMFMKGLMLSSLIRFRYWIWTSFYSMNYLIILINFWLLFCFYLSRCLTSKLAILAAIWSIWSWSVFLIFLDIDLLTSGWCIGCLVIVSLLLKSFNVEDFAFTVYRTWSSWSCEYLLFSNKQNDKNTVLVLTLPWGKSLMFIVVECWIFFGLHSHNFLQDL